MSTKKEKTEAMPTCGIIMPISTIDNCLPEHWADVLEIIKDVCEVNGFKSDLVSDGLDVGVIQNRIVENVYSSDIVICDVSCKNANVMFELGMRLAFDKPTIIIKDENTDYCFDTGLIEHIEYPRDLRFNKINSFKEKLGKKLVATYDISKADPTYSTFLKHFSKFKIAQLNEVEITSENYILKAIDELKSEFRSFRNVSIQESHIKPLRLNNNIPVPPKKTLTAYEWIQRKVYDYINTLNTGDPFDSEKVISEVFKSIENSPMLSHISDKKTIEKAIRESVLLL